MTTSQNIAASPSRGWISRLGTIGDRPEDSAEERLRHSLLIYMGVLMSGGGLIWGGLATYYGMYLPAIIPFGYTAATIVNLTYFARSKSFVRVRFVQVLMSLILPFLFQWVLGGFAASGAVMLWSMLSIVGSLTFTGGRTTIRENTGEPCTSRTIDVDFFDRAAAAVAPTRELGPSYVAPGLSSVSSQD